MTDTWNRISEADFVKKYKAHRWRFWWNAGYWRGDEAGARGALRMAELQWADGAGPVESRDWLGLTLDETRAYARDGTLPPRIGMW